ncbi:MAG: hypothetical protein DRP00_02170 [Candidatus Aenigmatarchaeota archaeon]|nr:MAG: hypothetical protein DRP00_02170 [Candidatus Aenigmarchaeota archaeon]
MESFPSFLSLNEIIEKDEIVLYILNEGIFTPSFRELDRFIETCGFRPLEFKSVYFKRDLKDLRKFTTVYKDSERNYLIIEGELKLVKIKPKNLDVEISIGGVVTNRYGLVYKDYSGEIERVDLVRYAKFLRENYFDKFLEKVLSSLSKKYLDLYYIE